MPHLLRICVVSVKKSANESAIVLFHRVEGVVFAPATLNTYVPSEHSIGVNKGGGCQGGAATLLTDSNSNQLKPHKGARLRKRS